MSDAGSKGIGYSDIYCEAQGRHVLDEDSHLRPGTAAGDLIRTRAMDPRGWLVLTRADDPSPDAEGGRCFAICDDTAFTFWCATDVDTGAHVHFRGRIATCDCGARLRRIGLGAIGPAKESTPWV